MTTTSISTGYYGARGWTTEKRIKNVLRPYLNANVFDEDEDSSVLGGFEPFQGLGAVGAQRLLATLPMRNLADRQNYSPTCEAMLRAAVDNPGRVELVGYAIGPERADERVSIEGLIYYADLHYNVTDFHDETCECDDLWSKLRESLGLTSALDRPDELRKLRPSWNPSNEAWWIWWD
ncbi:MAG: hypothetical protein Q4D87_01100 [Actinomycetaceae bacterium]|nr:hypothetical protein [Actinomycetaceae bacterium]